MTIVRLGASALLLASLALLPACASGPTMAQEQPDPSALTAGDRGLQSKNIIEMTDRMAPDIIASPVVAQNPTAITVVVMDMQNATASQSGQNFDIVTARLAGLLARHATAHVAFVERKAMTEYMQKTEGAGNTDIFEQGSRTGIPAPTRQVAQYALYGKVSEMRNNNSSYYLCEFKLTNMSSGVIVWQNFYETKTLD